MAVRFGKYEVERELGRGASGVTYLARDPALKRRVALKVLVPPHTVQGVAQAQLVERFTREARAAASIRHPCVPRIDEVGQVAGRPFIAMEYCEGQTLREVLTMQGPMHPARAVQTLRQVLGALQAAHALGIYHRDVKPENVMLLADGSVKLMDFGIARVSGEQTLTQTGAMLGTPAYMSPEQILGRSIDGRTDLFSVGVMLHEMLTGRRPFQGQTITQITHAIIYEEPQFAGALPGHLRDVIGVALQKDATQRFQSAQDMAGALDPTRSPKPTQHQVPAPVGSQPRPGPQSAPGMAPTILGGSIGHPNAHSPASGNPLTVPPNPAHPPAASNPNLRPCPSCGRGISVYASACPGCGHPLAAFQPAIGRAPPGYIQKPFGHSPVVAVLLSLLCCVSAGQFYNGQILKGILLLLAAFMSGVLTAGWSVLIFWVLCSIDAGIVASRLSRGEAVSEWQSF